MNLHLTSVTNVASASGKRPGFYFYAEWLPSMGFIPGALVQAIPEPEEMIFNLCDDNISKYSALDAQTKAQGGKLIQVFTASEKYKQSPTLATSGKFVHDAGLNYGDTLIAKYEYGHIRVRKLPGKSKIIYMTSIKDERTGKRIPKVKLTGEWLPEFGFTPYSSLTVSSEPGIIVFTAWNGDIEKYADLVRYAREHKLKLIQVREMIVRGKPYTNITTVGSCVEKAGFTPGDALLATCGNGVIKIQKLDFSELGF